jgi:thiol-disulfide isomerase/thioredoxin
MRKTCTLLLGMLFASVAMCALASAQSSPKRRAPVLTNEDLGSSREPVRLSLEGDNQPSGSAKLETARGEIQPAENARPDTVRGPIQWHRDLRRAFDAANADGKLVIVDVYTDWCGWCKKMDQTIYSNSTIAGLSRQQVFVKVNAEDGGQGQNFAEQMRVKGFPTTIILDGRGRVLNVAQGYIASPQAFMTLVQEARAAHTR